MSEKIAVYIVSMGDTPQAINEFARRFSARFGIPEPKVLALSRRLPGKVGSYHIDKAKLLGIEIRKMGGQVSLRREATEGPRPIPVTPLAAEGEAESWVVHGHAESQEDLVSMTQAAPGEDTAPPTPYDYPSASDDDMLPPPSLPPERKIAGKFEAKQVYTVDQTYGLDDEHFKKVKSLYAGRKEKRGVTASPAFRIILIVFLVLLAVYLYIERFTILKHFMGFETVTLTDAYEHRLPPNVQVPTELTGDYTGDMKYTTRAGDIAFVEVSLTIEGRNVHNVIVDVSSTDADIGKYRLTIEYSPGSIKYTRVANNKTIYSVEGSFPSTGEDVASIDETGRFTLTLDAIDAKIDPRTVPQTEKDRLGNMVFLKMEGAYAGNGQFYGGLLTSHTPLMGWGAKKK